MLTEMEKEGLSNHLENLYEALKTSEPEDKEFIREAIQDIKNQFKNNQ